MKQHNWNRALSHVKNISCEWVLCGSSNCIFFSLFCFFWEHLCWDIASKWLPKENRSCQMTWQGWCTWSLNIKGCVPISTTCASCNIQFTFLYNWIQMNLLKHILRGDLNGQSSIQCRYSISLYPLNIWHHDWNSASDLSRTVRSFKKAHYLFVPVQSWHKVAIYI